MKTSHFLACAALCALPDSLSAATATWHGGFGFTPDWWTIGNNWPGGFPGPAHDVVFPAGAAFIGTVLKVNHTVNTLAVNAPGYGFEDDGTAGAVLSVTAGITASYGTTPGHEPPPHRPPPHRGHHSSLANESQQRRDSGNFLSEGQRAGV